MHCQPTLFQAGPSTLYRVRRSTPDFLSCIAGPGAVLLPALYLSSHSPFPQGQQNTVGLLHSLPRRDGPGSEALTALPRPMSSDCSSPVHSCRTRRKFQESQHAIASHTALGRGSAPGRVVTTNRDALGVANGRFTRFETVTSAVRQLKSADGSYGPFAKLGIGMEPVLPGNALRTQGPLVATAQKTIATLASISNPPIPEESSRVSFHSQTKQVHNSSQTSLFMHTSIKCQSISYQ